MLQRKISPCGRNDKNGKKGGYLKMASSEKRPIVARATISGGSDAA